MSNKIKVKDLATNKDYPNAKNLYIDDWDTCEEVFRKQVSFDSEKGSVKYEVVVKKNDDGKFYRFTYTESLDWDNVLEQVAEEVFESKQILSIYSSSPKSLVIPVVVVTNPELGWDCVLRVYTSLELSKKDHPEEIKVHHELNLYI